ncbi:histidine kinase [Actinoplanes sp. NPDC051470]|uniref:sensor histidine kinase n=1 Tax=unclassified Actinoplanes TaxID=2626549 RepID=UPI00341FA9A1
MRACVSDLGIAALAFAGAAARVAAAPVQPADRAPDLLAYAMVLGMALALLARRQQPALVLAAVVFLFLAYHVDRYPGGAPAVPVWIALYSVAVAPRRRLGLLVAGVLIVIDAQSRMIVAGLGPLDAALDGSTGMFVAALLLGEAVRARRERVRLLAAERDRVAEQRVTEERIRIARELHDLSAHTLAVVSVQAAVAADALDDDPDQVRKALASVRGAAREAMTELRAAVGVLRDGVRGVEPAPTLERLPSLASATGATLVEEGDRRTLPRAVEATAYRIVQEAVANAVRHAGASTIEIRVGYAADGVSLAVRDDGTGGGGPPGNGLRGMTERATGLGGWVRAGRAGHGGFEVRGWLPA